MLFSHGCSFDINVLAILSVKIHYTGPFTKIMRFKGVIGYFSPNNLNADYIFQQIKHCYIRCWLCTILVKFYKKQIEKQLFIVGINLKIVHSHLKPKTKSHFHLKPCSYHGCCLVQSQFTKAYFNCLFYNWHSEIVSFQPQFPAELALFNSRSFFLHKRPPKQTNKIHVNVLYPLTKSNTGCRIQAWTDVVRGKYLPY